MANIGYTLLSITFSLAGVLSIWFVWIVGSFRYGELARVGSNVGIWNLIAISVVSFVISFFFIIRTPAKKSLPKFSSQLVFGICILPLLFFFCVLAARYVHSLNYNYT